MNRIRRASDCCDLVSTLAPVATDEKDGQTAGAVAGAAVGGGFGAIFGGPLGAVIGAAAGSWLGHQSWIRNQIKDLLKRPDAR